jgi:hypothetical protein
VSVRLDGALTRVGHVRWVGGRPVQGDLLLMVMDMRLHLRRRAAQVVEPKLVKRNKRMFIDRPLTKTMKAARRACNGARR